MHETTDKHHARRLGIASIVFSLLNPIILILGLVCAQVNYIFDHLPSDNINVVIVALLAPVAGFITGIFAFAKTQRHISLFQIKPWIIVGIGISACNICFILLSAPAIMQHTHIHTRADTCFGNQHMLAQYAIIYEQDHQGQLPHSLDDFKLDSWQFECPARRDVIGYGYNRYVAGARSEHLGNFSTLLLTADGGDAQHFITRRSDIDDTRHEDQKAPFNWRLRNPRGFIASFADGHTAWCNAGKQVRLKP